MKLLLTLALVGPRHLGARLMRLAVALPMEGTRASTQRVLDVLFRLGDTLESLPTRWHRPAKALGLVCDRHFEEAPPWWEFEVDCAGHDCGVCFTCVPESVPCAPR